MKKAVPALQDDPLSREEKLTHLKGFPAGLVL